MNKVSITINGQEYKISGDRSEEDIRRIAAMVDERVKAIKEATNMPLVDVAVLAALNMGEEFLDVEKTVKDAEARSLDAHKEVERLRELLNQEKENTLHGQNSAAALEDQMKSYEEEVARLKTKVAEYENNFFDLQMQNIKLKNDLDKLRGNGNI